MAMLIIVAMLIRNSHVSGFVMPAHRQNRGTGFVNLLANALQKAGWHVEQPPESTDRGADLVARQGKKIYVFDLKASSEARKDRAIPLISQAILEAQRAAGQVSDRAIPVAVLASAHVSDSLAEDVKDFALRYAPDVGVGVIDASGFRRFMGHRLEALNAERSRLIETTRKEASPGNLFSDLNQWMLKILLSRSIPNSLLSAPRGHYENVSQLAEAAGVSVMSAFRLVRQLSEEGFLEERSGLRLVRTEELMERWLRASHYRAQETPARWILSGEKNRFHAALRSYVSRMASRSVSKQAGRVPPRLCLGLFAAAEVLGFKFVHGVQPHLYIERIDQEALRESGLSLEPAGREADMFVRVPKYSEAVFRAAVESDGVPISDILQVWLDVSNHPARGKDQADLLRKRIFSQILDKARA
jgi:hypothetical protein